MAAENNTKYIAEAWIEDGKDEDFKKSFLQSLVSQLQHHKSEGEGAGFDADMVDGMHYCQIVDVFDEKIKDFMGSFAIGRVLFNKEQQDYCIGFDGVKPYIDDIDGYENYMILPWETEPTDSGNDLMDVFESLYDKIKEIETNLNTQIIQNAQDISAMNTATGGLLDKVDSEGNFNADSVNGLRFFVVNQSTYDAYSADVKNNPRNVFIIKEGAIPQDILDYQPDTIPISNAYEFHVNTDTNHLEYRHANENVWHELAPLSDFYTAEGLSEIIVDVLNTDLNYTLNTTAVLDALKNIPLSSITNWDIPNPKTNFIIGGYYTENNTVQLMDNDYVENEHNFKYANLNPLRDNVISNIDTKLNALKNGSASTIKGLDTTIGSLSTNINNLKGGSTKTIKNLEDSITNLNTSINNLTKTINNLKNYTRYTGKFINDTSDIFYNDDLQLAFVQVQLSYNHKKKNDGSFVSIGSSYKLPAKFTPRQGFKVPNSPNVTIYFKADRTVMCRADLGKDKTFTILAGGMFFYK